MNNPKHSSKNVIEKREKEFCVHFNNANSNLPDNIRKNKPGSRRSRNSNPKSTWGSENKPENLPDIIEPVEKTENIEAKPKRERKGWGVPRPDPAESQEQQGTSDEQVSKSPLKEKELKGRFSNSNTSGEERSSRNTFEDKEDKKDKQDGFSIQRESLENRIESRESVSSKEFRSVPVRTIESRELEDRDEVQRGSLENNEGSRESVGNKDSKTVMKSLKNLDIKKLRQQMKEEKLKKLAPEPEAPKDSPLNRKIFEKPVKKADIQETEAPKDSPFNRKIEKPSKKIDIQEPEIPKDSPLNKKVIEKPNKKVEIQEQAKDSAIYKKAKELPVPKGDEIEEQIEEEIVEEINDTPVEPKEEVKKPATRLDSSYGKKPITVRVVRPLTAHTSSSGFNSNSKPMDLVFCGIPSKDKQDKKKLEAEKSIVENSKPTMKVEKKTKSQKENIPLINEQPVTSSTGNKNLLLKRVEKLDESSKRLLADILEKIETGSIDKDDLAKLESFNL